MNRRITAKSERSAVTERAVDHPGISDITLQGVLEALADPVRRSIVRQLANADQAMACGTFDVTVTRSTSTHHFRILRQAGVIRQHYVGTVKMNTLRYAELESLFPGLLTTLVDAANREAARSGVAEVGPVGIAGH